MLAHPILINRPIVVTPLGVRLCRPSETVLDILPDAAARRVREGGRRAGRRRRTAPPAGDSRTMSESVSTRAAASRPRPAALGFFERYLTLWVALCIVAGIALGHLLPGPVPAPRRAPRSPRSTCRWRC